MKWPFPLHNHNHFELVFIHSGSGRHVLNDITETYQGRCLFLLAPEDYHLFEIDKETEFSVLKFNNSYLDGTANSPGNEWNKLIDHLLAIIATNGSVLVKSADELDKVDALMRLIVSEWTGSLNSANEVVFYLIRSVFALIKKNALGQQIAGNLLNSKSLNSSLFISIMDYIHLHIHYPEKLNLAALASHFNFSPNHLNTLFKKQMGLPIKKYISEYKFKLIENRLKFGGLMIKELSAEFRFSDLSHFNKFLKRHSGSSPKLIRRKS